MTGYRWRDPSRWKQPASGKETPPRPPADVPGRPCAFCGMTGMPLRKHGKDLVCEDDEACLARGWKGSGDPPRATPG